MTAKTRHPFKVRKMTSGRNGDVRYIVVKNPGARRVTVVAHYGREGAQMEADSLNVSALVKDHADDPRPYDDRWAEAAAAYYSEVPHAFMGGNGKTQYTDVCVRPGCGRHQSEH